MLDLTQMENNTEVELIQENGNETNIEQFQHFWLMHSMVTPTTTIPPPPHKKITMCEKPFSKQIANQRHVAKGFLQNKQMGRANKKNWGEDIAYIRNLLALLTVWINPILLDSKLGKCKHNTLNEWIKCMWENYIRHTKKKLDQLRVKENSAINLVLKYMEDGHLDNKIKSLIAINHNFYRLIFSNASNMIYFNTSECHILNNFLGDFESWKHAKDVEKFFFSALSPATTS